MLGKLFKYEFRNTAKIMLTLYGVLAAVTIFGMIVISIPAVAAANVNTVFTFIGASAIVLYALAIIALVAVTYVYICVHFYKSMYSDQGYLTHTLPVSPVATLNVKILVSLFWLFFSMVLALLSGLFLVAAASRGELFTALSELDFSEMNLIVKEETGVSLVTFFIELFIMCLLSCLDFLMLVFTSASIGQLFNQHKGASAIIAGIVLYFAQQIASVIPILLFSVSLVIRYDSSGGSITADFPPAIGNMLIISYIILTMFFITAYYTVCNIIVRKHINLD